MPNPAQKSRWHLAALSLLLLSATGFMELPHTCVRNCPDPEEPTPPLTQANPAAGWSVTETGTEQDPFAAFGRRPIDEPRLIPQGGNYMDENRDGPHFGIDYTFPEQFLHSIPQPVYPIGPGIVTAVHPCLICWARSEERWGRLRTGLLEPANNFGFGALVVIEHPYNEYVSFYSLYAHLREVRVSVGQQVTSETQLALLGASGDVAAPHVHIEIRIGLPGQFWGANFSNLYVMRRWTQMRVDTPVYLFYPEHHVPYAKELELWVDEEYPIAVQQDIRNAALKTSESE